MYTMTPPVTSRLCLSSASAPPDKEGEPGCKDWVFINYTFKRFEGLTQRGVGRSNVK